MKVIAAPIYFLYKLWIGLVFWLSLMMLYPFFWLLLQRRTTFPLAFQLKRWWARILTTLMFCPVVKEYKGNIPNGPFVIASNHQSYLDTVFMYLVFSDYFVFILDTFSLFSSVILFISDTLCFHNANSNFLLLL